MNHEQLWAPWRMEYIKNRPVDRVRELEEASRLTLRPGGDPGCFMCRAVVQTNDRENLIVYRGERVFVVLNRYPYNNGHLLVAPYNHAGRLDEHEPVVHFETMSLTTRLVQVMERDLKAHGFNIGVNLGAVAGAGVPGHLHWHIVPRWNGDVNYMPSIAGTRIISQSLEALYDIMHRALNPTASAADQLGTGT
ncbi:MAG: HIT domain-containing protein [Planctomycetaceae bacterium]|nr:HIT domain-containing protein [Planctomycetaceae bacterium]